MTDLVDVTQLGGRPVTIHFGTTEGLPTERCARPRRRVDLDG
jgi:hypothetical protein